MSTKALEIGANLVRTQMRGSGLIAQSQSALPPFKLHRPENMTDLISLIRKYPSATLSAGGSDLVAQFREGHTPERLISLRKVRSLQNITFQDGILDVGAMVSHEDAQKSRVIAKAIPNLDLAWGSIATVRIRHRGTLGGNLLGKRVRYELHIIFGALDGQMNFEGGADTSIVPVRNLWEVDHLQGLLTSVSVDTRSLLWFGYERSMRPLTTIALSIRQQGASNLVISAVAGAEYRRSYLLELSVEGSTIDELDPTILGAELAAQLPGDAEDYNGSIEYRRHITSVLIRRLLINAQTEKAGQRMAP